MTTANSIIERALVKARVISPGESIPAGKAAQVLADLNDMLESWSLEGLTIPCDVLESFELNVGQGEYTYGDGGDFNSARPLVVKNSSYVRMGIRDYPVELYPLSTYRARAHKAESGIPEVIAYHPEFPLGKIFLWPLPQSGDLSHVVTVSGQVVYTGAGNYAIYTGSGVFGGVSGVTVDIGSTLLDTDYNVIIQAVTGDPLDIGSISVTDKGLSSFRVINTGSDTVSSFDWIVTTSSGSVFPGVTVLSGMWLFLQVSKLLSGFSTLTTDVTFYPGYLRAIVNNLAIEISPNFGKKVSGALAAIASASKSAIRSANSRNHKLLANPDFARLFGPNSGYNIISGS